jgi:glutamate racemase
MNKKLIPSQPIGIFDSGIGGLTVAKALQQMMPQEDLIYFGDTAHMPYGDKSATAIGGYAVKIVDHLLELDCKLILIACNSASAAAYHLIKEHVKEQALVINVIDPLIDYVTSHYKHKMIGLIGTRQTVHSQIYQRKIAACGQGIQLSAWATNLLASAIEEFGNHPLIDSLLQVYLGRPQLQNIHALILACTHYPIIKERISQYYQHSLDIIDSSLIVAQNVKTVLAQHHLLAVNPIGKHHFYISDYTDSFAANAKIFFGNDVILESYPLWEK